MTDPAAWPEETQAKLAALGERMGLAEGDIFGIARAALTLDQPQGIGAHAVMHSMPLADMNSIEALVRSKAEALDEFLASYSAPPDGDAAARYEAFRVAFRGKDAQQTMIVLMHVLTLLRIADDGEATIDRELFRESFAEAAAQPEETDEEKRAARAAYLVHRLEQAAWRGLQPADREYAGRIAAKVEANKVEPYELRDLEDMVLRAQPGFEQFATPWGQEEKRKEFATAALAMLRTADVSRLDADEQAWVAEQAAKTELTEDEVRIAWRLYARMERGEEFTIKASELVKYMADGFGWVSGDMSDEFVVVRDQRRKAP